MGDNDEEKDIMKNKGRWCRKGNVEGSKTMKKEDEQMKKERK